MQLIRRGLQGVTQGLQSVLLQFNQWTESNSTFTGERQCYYSKFECMGEGLSNFQEIKERDTKAVVMKKMT